MAKQRYRPVGNFQQVNWRRYKRLVRKGLIMTPEQWNKLTLEEKGRLIMEACSA